jgi:hypothetical protein
MAHMDLFNPQVIANYYYIHEQIAYQLYLCLIILQLVATYGSQSLTLIM